MLITATDICTLIIAELLWVCYISTSFGFKGWNYNPYCYFLALDSAYAFVSALYNAHLASRGVVLFSFLFFSFTS